MSDGSSNQPEGHLHCPTCGYNLTGLPENRCPECGGPFDLHKLAQRRNSLSIERVIRLLVQGALAPLVLGCGVRLFDPMLNRFFPSSVLLVLALLLGNAVWLLFLMPSPAERSHSDDRFAEGVLSISTVLGLLMVEGGLCFLGLFFIEALGYTG